MQGQISDMQINKAVKNITNLDGKISDGSTK
jgi:hypothetical protein